MNRPIDSYYYHVERDDIAALVPRDAKVILDVGCGAGALGKLLKASRDCQVVGMEVTGAGVEAAEHLDEVVCGDVDTLNPPGWQGRFDCVIYGDVLEHLRDPWVVIRRHVNWLRKGGFMVASIPNVQHHSVIRGLLRGKWEYADYGLMDRTHLRFFTKSSTRALFEQAGLRVKSIAPNPMGRFARLANWLSLEKLEGFLAFKYFVLSDVPELPPGPT